MAVVISLDFMVKRYVPEMKLEKAIVILNHGYVSLVEDQKEEESDDLNDFKR